MSVLYVKMENYSNLFFLSEGKSIVSDNTYILDIQVLTSQFHVAGLNAIEVSVTWSASSQYFTILATEKLT